MIVTHSGRFHADDVFATAMILMIETHEVVRSRDEEVIAQADVVLDVGAEYDPSRRRYDHHQNSFTEQRANGVPYATAGLVWKHYAHQILAKKGLQDPEMQNFAFEWVDKKLINDIDAVDNGLFSDDPRPSISQVIAMMNRSSDEPEEQLIAFNQAVELTSNILDNYIKAGIKEAEVAQELHAYLPSVEAGVLVLDKNLPFKDFLRSQPQIHRVVYPRSEDSYGVYCNGQDNHLPQRFRGLRDQELVAVSGLDDAIFCHKSGFMAVTVSQQSALALAESK